MSMAQLQSYGLPDEWPAVLPPAQPIPFTAAASKLLTNKACVLMGWSNQNHGAGSDILTFIDGSDANGQVVGYSRMATGTSDTEILAPSGVICQTGLFVEMSAGTTNGVVYVIIL